MASYIKPIIYKDSIPRYTPKENSSCHFGYPFGYTEIEAFSVAERIATEHKRAHKNAQSDPYSKEYNRIEIAVIPLQEKSGLFYLEDRSTRKC